MIYVQNQKYLYTKVSFKINKNFLLELFMPNNAQNTIFSFQNYYDAKILENYNSKIFIFKKYKE